MFCNYSKKITPLFVFLFVFFTFNCASAKEQIFKEVLVKFRNSEKYEVVNIGSDVDFEELMKEYRDNELVEHVEPNFFYYPAFTPDDSYYENQWYLKKIRAPQAWNKQRRANDIVIAIIDSGVQIDHPDLKNNIWSNKKEIPDNNIDDDRNGFIDDYVGWNFVNNTNDPVPKFEEGFTEAGVLHGTIVAGVASAEGNNNRGITGVSWSSKIMPLKILNDKGEGKTSNVIKAIDYAVDNGADVINLSFIGSNFSQALYESIERAYKSGVVVVAAAGNEEGGGDGYNLYKTPMYPACMDGKNGENMVIGVVATDTLDQKADFSSYGFKCVDIAAPGISIFSASTFSPKNSINGNSFSKYYDGYWSGTSMATSIISGALALIQGANPNLNRLEIVDVLLKSTDNISRLNPDYLGQLGSGRINLEKAVINAKSFKNFYKEKLLIAPLEKAEAKVKITDINGKVLHEFFAFPKEFKIGAEVVAGDIDGDSQDEIIAGAGNGGGPQVRIFNSKGEVLGQFFAYDKNFRGGVHVALGDIDGDGKDEIIAGAGNGGGPQVRIFNSKGEVLGQFFAYDKNFRGGVRVATGNVDEKARNVGEEIITAPGPGGGPHIRIFNGSGGVKKEFFAFGDKFRGGVQVSLGDVDADGKNEIIAGTGPVNSPYVRVFEVDGVLKGSFYAFEKEEIGVNVSTIKF